MPRIADSWINIAVYMYESLDAARDGERFGASGFIVTAPLCEDRDDWLAAYVVTNKHVIKNPHNPHSRTPVIRMNRKDGTPECISTTEEQWICHERGDDVAVFQLNLPWEHFKIAALGVSDFATPQIIADEDIGIGDDTAMVGRFINHEGKQKNAPSVRFGNIAMMNSEAIHNDELGIDQESFLVETRSLPGYSGSAVLLYSPCAMNDMSERRFGKQKTKPQIGTVSTETSFAIKQMTARKGPYLLGIDWCHIHRPSYVLNRDGKKIDERWYVEENTGMAGVIPAWKITEILNCEELAVARRQEAEQYKQEARGTGGSTLDRAERPEPTQVTREGAEIPIPTQEQFLDDLTKATRKIKPD